MAINHSNRKHALLSASGSHKWMHCTPSVKLEEKFENKSSVFADEGTLAHELSELKLRLHFNIITQKAFSTESLKIKKNSMYGAEMESFTDEYVNYVVDVYTKLKKTDPNTIISIEERLDFSNIVEHGFGTGDIVIVSNGIIHLIDLKYGKGVPVSAHKNSQLMLYGVGAMNKYDLLFGVESITLHIVQPRLYNFDSFEVSADELIRWSIEDVKPKAELAYSGEGDQHAGEWCKFCRAKSICRKYSELSLDLAKHEFKDPELLEKHELVDAFKKASLIIDWIGSLKEYMLSQALSGEKYEGLKLVKGKSNRAWTDKTKAIAILESNDYLEDEYMKKSFSSVAAIEKLVGAKKFKNLFADTFGKPEGAPALVESSDPRPEKNSLYEAKSEFADDGD